MDKPKAQELIAQLQKHQQDQIQCLQALFGLASEGKNEDKGPGNMEEVEDGRTKLKKSVENEIGSSNPSGSDSSARHGPSEERVVQIPDDWALPWDNALLRRRIEEREKEPGCGGGLRVHSPNADPADPAVTFISANALKDLAQFTFEREDHDLEDSSGSGNIAFFVIDSDRHRKVTLNTNSCSGKHASAPERSEVIRTLFSPRTVETSLSRFIAINAFTPSALSAVLLSASKDKDYDYTTAYAALRRHLSTKYTDRHYDESHVIIPDPYSAMSPSRSIVAFTVPYFSLTEQTPAVICAPLSPSGLFGIDSMGGKHIREEKFSLSWSGAVKANGPSLIVAFSPLTSHGLYIDGSQEPLYAQWVANNLFLIRCKWEGLLDSLDEQTTLSSSITFNSEMRQKILFEDRNFTNSKRYFWALQSLRLFAEHIEGTLRSIPDMFYSVGRSTEDYDTVQEMIAENLREFGILRDRVERKRQEIQSLSDGLFSASSVAEGRLTSEQNANIRLLTMVTIAYLPLTLATSIYSMNALPKSAGIASYVVVTILMCAITYILVLNLRHLKEAVSWGRSSVRNMLHTQKMEGQEKWTKRHKMSRSDAERTSTMA